MRFRPLQNDAIGGNGVGDAFQDRRRVAIVRCAPSFSENTSDVPRNLASRYLKVLDRGKSAEPTRIMIIPISHPYGIDFHHNRKLALHQLAYMHTIADSRGKANGNVLTICIHPTELHSLRKIIGGVSIKKDSAYQGEVFPLNSN